MTQFSYQTAHALIVDFNNPDTWINLLVECVEALIVVVALLTLGRLIKRVILRIARRASHNPNLATLLSNLAYVGIILLCIIWVLAIFTGTGLSSLITLLGIVSVAISLSIQDVLKNFVAGIFLLLEQPFRIGDRIQVREIQGKVETIEIRTTKLSTDEGLLVIIPNGIVFTEVVTNRTASDHTLVSLQLILSPGQSLSEISHTVSTALKPFMPDEISPLHPPAVRVESVTEGKTTAVVEFWTMRGASRSIKMDVAAVLREALPDVDINTKLV